MDSLDLIQTFREVARRGSFSGAARALDMSPPNVSKYVAALEQRFGVRLFNRTTRKVSLTDAGQLLYERTGPVLELVQMTQGELLERAIKPSGRLTVSAPPRLMHTPLPAMLGRFLTQHPAVTLRLQLTNRVVDLVEEGVDIGLRIGPIPDASMIVRRLTPVTLTVAATPAYWQMHGVPSHPRELLTHHTLAAALHDAVPVWHFSDHGKPLAVTVQPRVVASDNEPLLTLVQQDLGVVYMPTAALIEHLDNGTLQAALTEFMPRDIWLYAAYAQRRHNSAAMASMLDFLEQETKRLIGEHRYVVSHHTAQNLKS
ncbi:LysR substrate-binding domain-containing protein [Ottowia sp.]|uniref:LysR family transcriptional regulator n=1 Tax=Ottowia sp. TaxID=1898956 RepID=UPI003A85FD42